MTDNPLSGLRIPSLSRIVDEAIDGLGRAGMVNMASALVRQQIKDHILRSLEFAIRHELAGALSAATERAIEHVCSLMRDPDYQAKKAKAQKARAKRRATQNATQEAKDKETRIEKGKSDGKLTVVTVPKPVIQ